MVVSSKIVFTFPPDNCFTTALDLNNKPLFGNLVVSPTLLSSMRARKIISEDQYYTMEEMNPHAAKLEFIKMLKAKPLDYTNTEKLKILIELFGDERQHHLPTWKQFIQAWLIHLQQLERQAHNYDEMDLC